MFLRTFQVDICFTECAVHHVCVFEGCARVGTLGMALSFWSLPCTVIDPENGLTRALIFLPYSLAVPITG